MMKSANVYVNYHKAGDDFAYFLEKAGGVVKVALVNWAEMLEASANHLKGLAHELTPQAVAHGDTHRVEVTDEDRVINRLIKDGSLSEGP